MTFLLLLPHFVLLRYCDHTHYSPMWAGLIKVYTCSISMEGSVFTFTRGQKFEVTPEAQESFDKDGYILVR